MSCRLPAELRRSDYALKIAVPGANANVQP